jgi:hypothetical protein
LTDVGWRKGVEQATFELSFSLIEIEGFGYHLQILRIGVILARHTDQPRQHAARLGLLDEDQQRVVEWPTPRNGIKAAIECQLTDLLGVIEPGDQIRKGAEERLAMFEFHDGDHALRQRYMP